jgi:flagellar FliL protein
MAVSEDVTAQDENPRKKSKLPLIIGVLLAVLGGFAGFMATQMGLLPFGPEATESQAMEKKEMVVTEDVVFIPLDPITVTLPPGGDRQLLRLTAQLDVAPHHAEEVKKIAPRIIDILNSYLRAVQITDLETPAALLRLRTQMLHRVQVVAGQGVVRDLLITEFILN